MQSAQPRASPRGAQNTELRGSATPADTLRFGPFPLSSWVSSKSASSHWRNQCFQCVLHRHHAATSFLAFSSMDKR